MSWRQGSRGSAHSKGVRSDACTGRGASTRGCQGARIGERLIAPWRPRAPVSARRRWVRGGALSTRCAGPVDGPGVRWSQRAQPEEGGSRAGFPEGDLGLNCGSRRARGVTGISRCEMARPAEIGCMSGGCGLGIALFGAQVDAGGRRSLCAAVYRPGRRLGVVVAAGVFTVRVAGFWGAGMADGPGGGVGLRPHTVETPRAPGRVGSRAR
ncbi:Uncharacterised protein [Mycobacteroides abscessus subsp. abscessus]|nr:Uncharacterised protein [Mycobacteroides abscessus subsp. abscessus]